MRVFIGAVVLLLIGLAQQTKAQDASFTVNGRKVLIDTLNRDVDRIMDDVGIPGMSLAVIDQDKVVYSHAYGYRKLAGMEKADEGTVFEAASLSKTFMVFVANKLADEGKLDLDKPLYQYLENDRLKHDPRYKRITSRMILSHSSGIENWQRYNNPDTLEILSDPGTKYVYSGEGFQYLAAVIETILHKSYEQYVREMVIEPMQLKHTFMKYEHDGKDPEDHATGYDSFEKEIKKWKNYSTVPASGMHLVAKDYATVLLAIFDRQYISDSSTRKIYKPVIALNPDNPAICFGLGLAVQYTPDDTIIFHTGYNDGFKSTMWYSIVKKCGLVMLCNSEREESIQQRMSDLTVHFNLVPFFADNDFAQYPSNANTLLKIYREKKAPAMFAGMDEMRRQGTLDEKALNELGELFMSEDTAVSKKTLETDIALYPTSSFAWFTLGSLYVQQKEYDKARLAFVKARQFNYDLVAVETAIRNCDRDKNKQK